MSHSDPIADFLTRLRNAGQAQLRYVDVCASKLVISIIEILKKEGFVKDFAIKEEGVKRTVRVFLRYDAERRSLIRQAVRMSKPGRRLYVGYSDLKPVEGGIGKAILTTHKGIVTGDEARRQRLGGEFLCYFA
jgi:small subunit ribosomal protein S8